MVLPAHRSTGLDFVVVARRAVGDFAMDFRFAVEDNGVLRMLPVQVKGKSPTPD